MNALKRILLLLAGQPSREEQVARQALRRCKDRFLNTEFWAKLADVEFQKAMKAADRQDEQGFQLHAQRHALYVRRFKMELDNHFTKGQTQ